MESNGIDTIPEDEAVTSLIDMTSLKVAIRALDVTGVTEILKTGIDLQANLTEPQKYKTALHDLIITYCSRDPARTSPYTLGRFAEILNIFIDNGLDIHDNDITGQCALHMAASHTGSSDVIKILLELGAKVNKPDRTQQSALHKAAACGGRHECVVLVQAGSNPHLMDCRGYTPLHVAARKKNNVVVIKQLMELGAKINLQDTHQNKCGPTALHVACRYGNVSNVKSLLKHGAQTYLQEGSGQTCVHLAAVHDMTGKILHHLLKARAPTNTQDYLLADTPLHKAITHQMNDNILTLIKHGANPNLPNATGDSAVHKAAVHCTDISIWTALLKGQSRFSFNAVNRDGLSPKERALREKNTVAVCMLRQYEEEVSLADAKSPRLHPRSIHARDVAISPSIMRRNISA